MRALPHQREPDHPKPHHRERERGVALILGILFTIVVLGITFSGTLVLQSHRQKTETNFALHGQADQFARSGLTDAVGWLKKQTTQPVTVFAPRRDTSVNPALLETDDPEIGIMRQFAITGAVWGRYEVWKPWAGDPDPQRLAWREQHQAEDVSQARNTRSDGTVWRLRSIGYVFRMVDPSKPFDQLPNQVLGTEILEVEARRVTIVPPYPAAISAPEGTNVHINTKGRVYGQNGTGIYYGEGNQPTIGPPNPPRVSGTPSMAQAPPGTYMGSIEDVFSVSLEQLRLIADQVVTDPANFPVPVPDASIIVVDTPNITFDSARPLMGFGILYFSGNATVLPGSNSSFSGLIYSEGSFTLRAPSEIRGSMVINGNLTIQGASDFASVYYDEEVLAALRRLIGNYRISSPFMRPFNADRPH